MSREPSATTWDEGIMGTETFDLVVIGAGPAGLSGALAAAAFRKKVALVERLRSVGGAGINTGTIPSKALRESALVMSGWRARRLLGLDIAIRREATLAEFVHHQRNVVQGEREEYESRLERRRVRVFRGTASFADPHTVRVAGDGGAIGTLRGDVILIAVGSSPARPPGFPFEHPRVHDSDEILEIAQLPERLAVVGAGVIGSEYACTFRALGVEVHLIDGRDTLLPFLDREISTALARIMERSGIRFHWKERIADCRAPETGDVELTLSSGQRLAVTDVLVASGRRSNTAELNLSAAGLAADKRDMLGVDASYRTSVPHILAAGDVIGAPALAATAMEQARVAVARAFDLVKKEVATILPSGIYTIPEIGTAGETEQALGSQGVDVVVGRAHFAQIPRGRLVGDESGFLKLLFRHSDRRLLGVHVIGEQATELVHIGMMILACEGDLDMLNRACFNYPTLGDLYKYAAYDALRQFEGIEAEPERAR